MPLSSAGGSDHSLSTYRWRDPLRSVLMLALDRSPRSSSDSTGGPGWWAGAQALEWDALGFQT